MAKQYKLDLNAEVLDYDEEVIQIPKKVMRTAEDVEAATLRRVLMMSLATPAEDRRNAEALLDDMELARRIRTGGTQEFNESEAKILRDQVVYRFMKASQVPQGELASGALKLIDAGKCPSTSTAAPAAT